MENLPKIKSITKKLVVALLGGFLLLFLAFHMCANLFVLKDDGGTAYSAFCHFMGTNVIVKVFEVVLMATVLFHIIITVLLWFQNRNARGPVRYHEASKTKTAVGSKLTIWTGILILVFLCVHFWGFYFVKLNITQPQGHTYMAKAEMVQNDDVRMMIQACAQYGMEPEQFVSYYEEQFQAYASQMTPEQAAEMMEQVVSMKKSAAIAKVAMELSLSQTSEDGKWIHQLNKEQKNALKTAGVEVEPDFYHNVRYMFSKKADENKNSGIISVLLYLFFFVVLWFHLRHALEACFQTLGLTNYKYHRAIEVIGIAYAWIICLGFASLPVILYFF